MKNSKKMYNGIRIMPNSSKAKMVRTSGIVMGHKPSVGSKTATAGITLIALVVTIVVLLILAGITIQLVFADGGILGQANKAKEQTEIAVLREKIDNVRISYITDKMVEPSLPIDNLWDRLISDIIASKEDVEGPVVEGTNNIYTLNTKDGYTVEIIENEGGLPEIGDITKGALPPVIRKIEVSSTDTSIKARATVSRLKNGSVEFWCKLSTENDSEYKPMPFISNEEGASINITLQEGATYKVKVTAKNDAGEHTDYSEITIGLKVKEITLDKTQATIKLNDTLQLNSTITPEEAENKKVTWSSSNEDVATVDENGLVTAVTHGNAVITVATTDGSNLQATCNITVKIPVESITLNKTSLTLGVEGKETLAATIKPDDADNKNVTWSSADNTIATVSSTGEVTGVKVGETTITVTAEDNGKKSASCKVTVIEKGAIPYSWKELGKIAKAISNTTTYNETTTQISVEVEGDTKTLKVGDWTRIDGRRVRILGFNHDTLTTSTAYGEATLTGKAGISFEYLDSLMDDTQMHSSSNNSNGWVTKTLYTTLNNTTNGKYKDLQNAGVPIKQVQKIYNATYSTNDPKTSSDYLWLLSCSEIWENSAYSGCVSGYSKAEEGKQYAYYSNCSPKPVYDSINANTVHYDSTGSSAVICSLRSPYYGSNRYFCFVGASGYCNGNYANFSYGVAPGFSI